MVKKISIFLIVTTLLLTMIPIKTYASVLSTNIYNLNQYTVSDPNQQDVADIMNIANPILGAIYYIGIFISIGILMIIGIKYMMGSIEEKAQYKETLFPYLIGAVLLFGGVNILRIIYAIVQKAL